MGQYKTRICLCSELDMGLNMHIGVSFAKDLDYSPGVITTVKHYFNKSTVQALSCEADGRSGSQDIPAFINPQDLLPC
jgi:hypothetical protein